MDAREGGAVEFKRETNSNAVETIIAFANTGGGTLHIVSTAISITWCRLSAGSGATLPLARHRWLHLASSLPSALRPAMRLCVSGPS